MMQLSREERLLHIGNINMLEVHVQVGSVMI